MPTFRFAWWGRRGKAPLSRVSPVCWLRRPDGCSTALGRHKQAARQVAKELGADRSQQPPRKHSVVGVSDHKQVGVYAFGICSDLVCRAASLQNLRRDPQARFIELEHSLRLRSLDMASFRHHEVGWSGGFGQGDATHDLHNANNVKRRSAEVGQFPRLAQGGTGIIGTVIG
jgi:hypothetical protein